MSYTITTSGTKFDLLNPTPDMVDINDIVYSLCNTARFNGHARSGVIYTVGQHSVIASNSVSGIVERAPSGAELACLLHDASEAYTGDIISPVKSLFPQVKELEEGILRVVFSKFGLDYEGSHPSVKLVDHAVTVAEWKSLMPTPWSDHFPADWEHESLDGLIVSPAEPGIVRAMFMNRLKELT